MQNDTGTPSQTDNRKLNLRITSIILINTIIILLLFPHVTLSQTQLFNRIQQTTTGSPLPFVNSTHLVDINFRELKYFPDGIILNLPDNTSNIIQNQIFYPRGGYFFRDR